MKQQHIPQATAKRLPIYYRFLENLQATGKQRVSSSELSEAVKVDAATIRRDFSCFGALGKKGYGYSVEYLLQFFREILAQDSPTAVILVGVGNLGTALLNYNFQKNHNIQIVRAYDITPEKIGQTIGGVEVHHTHELSTSPIDCDIAILAVPVSVAQKTTDNLVHAGIEGILNFTPARLDVPSHIRVQHIDLTVELQTLEYFLRHYPLQKEE
ncbi:redox-sensing transcriptional repressor Rex [Caldalkalibacillus salinus]|uniref:redox-sensing transcriptional repressor Rex n=1 Tax=Caldalkalibacillus salinus TaxID=2803787 RepID=UPI001922F19E|nr:redox-sensing transcriptional repressor Rex [Caldalkalibacillus salinus]